MKTTVAFFSAWVGKFSTMRGSLLVEIMLSAFLLFVGVLAIMRTFPASYRYATVSEHHLTANRVGAAVVAELQALKSNDTKGLDSLRNFSTTLQGANENSVTTMTYKVEQIRFRYGGIVPDASRVAEVAVVTIGWHEGAMAGGDAAGDKRVEVAGGIHHGP